MNKILNNEKLRKIISNTYFIILMLAILSILSGVLLLNYNFVGFASDLYFHWQRIWELRRSISQGVIFPRVALNQFNETGTAVMTMYPYVNLFPIVALSFVIKNFVHLVYITFILSNFLSLLIGYFSSLAFSKSKKVSFLFSVAYTLSSVTISYDFASMDMGVASSLIFLPLVFFGTLELIKDNKYLELTAGMSLILFSHVLNFMISGMLVVILLVINYKKINADKVTNILKTAGLSMLITSVFWIPFVMLSIHNNVSTPPAFFEMSGTDITSLLTFIFSNKVDSSVYISIIAFVGIILGIIKYKHLNQYLKQIFWVAVSVVALCSPLFPWNVLNDTFMKAYFQFPWRFYIIPQLLLCYLFSRCVFKFKMDYKRSITTIALCVLAIVTIQIADQKAVINASNNNPDLNRVYDSKAAVEALKVSSADFKNVVANNFTLTQDYFPYQSIKEYNLILDRKALYDVNKQLNVNLNGDGTFEFKAPRYINELNFPFVYYNSINYQVKMDGKLIPFHSNVTQLMTINNVKKGKHIVQISVHNSWYDVFSYMLSLIGIIMYIFLLFKTYFKKKNGSLIKYYQFKNN